MTEEQASQAVGNLVKTAVELIQASGATQVAPGVRLGFGPFDKFEALDNAVRHWVDLAVAHQASGVDGFEETAVDPMERFRSLGLTPPEPDSPDGVG